MFSLTTKLYIWKVNLCYSDNPYKSVKGYLCRSFNPPCKVAWFQTQLFNKSQWSSLETPFLTNSSESLPASVFGSMVSTVCWCKEAVMWHTDTSLYTRRTCMVPLNRNHPHPIIWTASIEKCCWWWSSTVFHCKVKEFSNCRVCFIVDRVGNPE